jgi:MYXO-CTERM domain-containing protein
LAIRTIRRGLGLAGRWIAVAMTIAAALTSTAAASPARILYFEPLNPASSAGGTALRKSTAPGTRQLRFEAYGRHFELSLEPNRQLTQQLAGSHAVELYRGSLPGTPRSWVRLAASGARLSGIVWDGQQAYIIEPAAEVSDALVEPAADRSGNVIFRLADVLLDPGAAACATVSESRPRKGDAAFASLLQELKNTPSIQQALGASRRLTIAALGDAPFLERQADAQAARDAIIARLNNIDGIFSSQLGVQIQLGALTVNDATTDPLSGQTIPVELLGELGRLRRSSAELSSFGLTHLFTGRELDGAAVGIAYLDSVCDPQYSAGLTQSRETWLDSLVAAHEIGHTLGADHDGDAGGSCAAAPTSGYLMASSIDGSQQFSQCSIERMLSRLQSAVCLSTLPPANVVLAADMGEVRSARTVPFTFSVAIANAGGLDAQNVRATLAVPPAIAIDEAYVTGGSCVSGAGMIQCQLGALAGGSTRVIHLSLRSDQLGTYPLSAEVTSDGESSTADNRGSGMIVIQPEADLAISLQGAASTSAGASYELGFMVTNHGAATATGISAAITLPSGVTAHGASLAGGSCAINGQSVQCTLATLPSGVSTSGSTTLSAAAAATLTLQADVEGEYVDPNPGNSQAQLTVTVTEPGLAAHASARSSGGGGAAGLMLLLGLAGLAGLRRR